MSIKDRITPEENRRRSIPIENAQICPDCGCFFDGDEFCMVCGYGDPEPWDEEDICQYGAWDGGE